MRRTATRAGLWFCVALLVVCASLAIITTGCEPARTNDDITYLDEAPGIRRFIDKEAGVVCWLYQGYGISCLPISVTNFGDN